MTVAALLRLIALFLAALFAPPGMLRRVRGFDAVQLWLFAGSLEDMIGRGEPLRYPGESLAIVAARIDLLAWVAFNPHHALRHMARRVRGWRRLRLAKVAPASFAPPVLWLAPVECVADAPDFTDTS